MRSDGGAYLIAEAGVNHNGSLDTALRLVDVAAEAGADAVKFQTFSARHLVSARAPKADYQVANTGRHGSQLEMLERLELSQEAHYVLAQRCRERAIAFMSTAFDPESQQFLSQFDMPATKIPSGDVTAAPLLLEAARAARPIILSTGMCTLADIEQALGVLAFGLLRLQEPPSLQAFADAYASAAGYSVLRERVTLLHCVSEYPAPVGNVNLRAMDVLRDSFGLKVGYSDHTMGLSVALAAVARGASVLEKHFTLDRSMEGPDHRASLEPHEMTELVRGVRDIESALGMARKLPSGGEYRTRLVARRSLVTTRTIRRGELFDTQNLSVRRPGTGRQPIHYWSVLGTPAPRDYEADETLEP